MRERERLAKKNGWINVRVESSAWPLVWEREREVDEELLVILYHTRILLQINY